MKNKLTDLNNHLFETLERLNDDSLDGEKLENEIGRAKAISDIAKNIIDNANIQLKALEVLNESSFNKERTQTFGLQFLGFKEED